MDYWLGPTPDMTDFDQTRSNEKNTLYRALEKWRTAWEKDFRLQFPDLNPSLGFSEDPMPYYTVGKWLLRYATRTQIGFGAAGAEGNAKITMGMLHQARSHEAHPKDKGASEVYGVEDLSFDMKLLFAPLDKEA